MQPPAGGARRNAETYGSFRWAEVLPGHQEQHLAVRLAQVGQRPSYDGPATGGVESGVGVRPWILARLASFTRIDRTHAPMGTQHIGGDPIKPGPSGGPALVIAVSRAEGSEPDIPEEVIGGLTVRPTEEVAMNGLAVAPDEVGEGFGLTTQGPSHCLGVFQIHVFSSREITTSSSLGYCASSPPALVTEPVPSDRPGPAGPLIQDPTEPTAAGRRVPFSLSGALATRQPDVRGRTAPVARRNLRLDRWRPASADALEHGTARVEIIVDDCQLDRLANWLDVESHLGTAFGGDLGEILVAEALRSGELGGGRSPRKRWST